jgi:hypothetical protein
MPDRFSGAISGKVILESGTFSGTISGKMSGTDTPESGTNHAEYGIYLALCPALIIFMLGHFSSTFYGTVVLKSGINCAEYGLDGINYIYARPHL